jgi:hypothetical protein
LQSMNATALTWSISACCRSGCCAAHAVARAASFLAVRRYRECPDRRDRQDQSVPKADRASKAHRVPLEDPDHKARRATRDQLDHKARRDLPVVAAAAAAVLDHRALRGLRDHQDPAARRDLKATRDRQELKVRLAQPDRRAHPVNKDLRVHKD